MTTLAVNTGRVLELGDRNEFPVIASDKIFEGAAVGLVLATGHARPLTSVDKFVGFAEEAADNSAGAAAAIRARTIKKGVAILLVSGAVITDVGLPVYAQDDNAFSFLKTGGVFVGFSRRYVEDGKMAVEFDAGVLQDPHAGLTAETVADDKTLDALDTGKLLVITVDAKTITLPAVAGLKVRVACGGAYGTIGHAVSPNTNDGVGGPDLAAGDNKDLLLTKATANRGDYVDLEYGDATGWVATRLVGTWTVEG